MSEFKVELIRVGEVRPHPNADALDITNVYQYPVVIRRGDFKPGDLAVYVPVDAIVPAGDPRWEFLGEHRRIKAKKLRGVFSMGLLVPFEPPQGATAFEGLDIGIALGITKYEPPVQNMMDTENEADPGFLPVYTDIEGLRRWPDILQPGEPVIITEKIHGANARFVFRDGRLWVGSRTNIKREDERNMWWRVAAGLKLAERLAHVSDMAIYGEVYGQVQDLKYGKSGVDLVLFDAMDTRTRTYLDHEAFSALAKQLDLPTVPVLYGGPWGHEMKALAEGQSLVPGAQNVREGFVVRPLHERFDERIGRVILKMLGEGYLTRKEKS